MASTSRTRRRSPYKACGFVIEGRSALDETGRPYPLLHLRLKTSPERFNAMGD